MSLAREAANGREWLDGDSLEVGGRELPPQPKETTGSEAARNGD
jgi:hypothetical protein